jgi:hypothetical protein
MNKSESVEGDETYQCFWGHELKSLLNRIFHCGEFLRRHALINDVDKDIWSFWDGSGNIFNRRILKFCGEIGLGNVFSVVSREWVASVAEGAHPELGSVIDLAVRIENTLAFAAKRIVFNKSHVLEVFHGTVETSNGHNCSSCHETRTGNDVP